MTLNSLAQITELDQLLSLDNRLANSVVNIFWKDQHSNYLGNNASHAKSFGVRNTNDIVGLNDYDIFNSTYADFLRFNDKEVLAKRTPQIFIETANLPDGSISSFFSYKLPYYNNMGKAIGVMGLSFYLTAEGHSLTRADACLTQQQKRCLYFLMKGHTFKQIANKMDLSPRTVEHYIEAVKIKLDCPSRAELIIKANELFKGIILS